MTKFRFAVPILFCCVVCVAAESGQPAENAWEMLPVFHNGRTMPLHTFARQIVKEICGTPNPYVMRPAADVPMPEKTAGRISQIIPAEGRMFTADEILLSWFSETQSQAWQFIPIFPVDDHDYAEDIFGAAGKGNRTSPHRVSLYQLEHSWRYQTRLAETMQRKQREPFPQKPVRFDQITEKIEQQAGLFKGLTFSPYHAKPERMIDLLERCASPAPESPSSYALVQEAWAILCSYGETAGDDSIHPTAARWHDIAGKLRFLLDTWQQKTAAKIPAALPEETENIFEQIIALTEESLDESAALMESLYPNTKYRTTVQRKDFDVRTWLPELHAAANPPHYQTAIRRSAITYHYAVKKMRNDIEAAYLALYDNGQSMRVMPLISPYVLEMGLTPEKYDAAPWATMQMIIGRGDSKIGTAAFTKRFIDTDSGAAYLLRDYFLHLFEYYSVQKKPYGSREFHDKAALAAGFLRSTAVKAELENRRQLAAKGESENPQIQDFVTKIAYPVPASGRTVSLAAEYRYDRLKPFWFMSFFAFAAVLAASGSYCAAALRFRRTEEMLFLISVAMLTFSAAAALIGAVMRALITGWAPVTNMYETVVLTALSAAVFGVWYTAYPLFQPLLSSAWEYSKITLFRADRKKGIGQLCVLMLRILLTVLIFYLIVLLANGGTTEHGLTAAVAELFAATDVIDRIVVAASVVLMLWFIPPVILTPLIVFVMTPFLLFRSSRIAAGLNGLNLRSARQEMLRRKLFIIITAGIVFLIGCITAWNRTELNPDFRPIAAVLRSNFWLTVHVFAIVVSYAAAFVAWGMAAVTLGYLIFGKYPRTEIPVKTSSETSSETSAETSAAASGSGVSAVKRIVQMPEVCRFFAPIIDRLLQFALLLLLIGTVLGARWADYSWGRFWSWDPKEVWALITIIFYVIVFHGKIARYYQTVGIITGALLASIAVIITWYGINFVFKGSVHSYGSGNAANATLFLTSFITVNLLWGILALIRYSAEMYGSEKEENSAA